MGIEDITQLLVVITTMITSLIGALFALIKWGFKHFDPHLTRLLDSIDDIRKTGQRMADIGERLVRIVETQQEWQEQLDAVLLDRHKRIMERLDSIDSAYARILYQMHDCPHNMIKKEG